MATGEDVGSKVGDLLGDEVGDEVGCEVVGEVLGEAVGSRLGAEVVGDRVGRYVGADVVLQNEGIFGKKEANAKIMNVRNMNKYPGQYMKAVANLNNECKTHGMYVGYEVLGSILGRLVGVILLISYNEILIQKRHQVLVYEYYAPI